MPWTPPRLSYQGEHQSQGHAHLPRVGQGVAGEDAHRHGEGRAVVLPRVWRPGGGGRSGEMSCLSTVASITSQPQPGSPCFGGLQRLDDERVISLDRVRKGQLQSVWSEDDCARSAKYSVLAPCFSEVRRYSATEIMRPSWQLLVID